MQSRFYELAQAGSDLTYEGNQQELPIAFYDELLLENDIKSDEQLQDENIDNVVLDISTILSGYLNESWSNEMDVGGDRVYNTLESVFGKDLAYHWEPSDNSSIQGVFHDEVGPEEIFRSIAELSEEVNVYHPDHTLDSLNAARSNKLSNLRDGGFGSFEEFKNQKNDYNKFRNQIVSVLNEESEELHAMRDAGMYEEVSNQYTGNSFNSLNFTEDDIIVDAARELDGRTAIATFDTDFIESDLTAMPPHLLAQMWSK